MESLGQLIEAFKDGGLFMYVILLIGVFAAFVIVERVWTLLRCSINGNHFMARIQSFLIANNTEEAIKFCNSASSKPLAKIIKNGLIRAPKGEKEVVHALEVTSLEEIPKLQKRTAYLPMFANVATLLGLLGTILGLILAFKAMDAVDPAARQARLSQGIAIAMSTTAFGLVVAIPCLLAFGWLQSMTNRILDEIDRASMKLLDLLKAKESADADDN